MVVAVVMILMVLSSFASYHNNLNSEHCQCLMHSQSIHVQCEHQFELYFVFHRMLPMDLGIQWFLVGHSTDILLEGHRGMRDFHTILVHHYAVDHCNSAINSFNIQLTLEDLTK